MPNSKRVLGDRNGGADDVASTSREDHDEFAVIERLRRRFAPVGETRLADGDLGIGDDAALVSLPSNPVVIATDLVVEGVHVDLDISGPADVGWKSVMVTVSDLGAMGAQVHALLLSVVVPHGFPIDDLADGVAQAAEVAGGPVVGGDLSSGERLVVSVTAMGSLGAPMDLPALRRDGARPGDLLVVTGPLGASAAGLRLARAGFSAGNALASAEAELRAPEAAAVAAHRRPVARLAEGEVARRFGVHAAIDISDGLVADAVHLAEASGVGIDLVVDESVVAPAATRDEALGGGEDYELLLATSDLAGLTEALTSAGLRSPIVVGRCSPDAQRRTLDGGHLPKAGWRHHI